MVKTILLLLFSFSVLFSQKSGNKYLSGSLKSDSHFVLNNADEKPDGFNPDIFNQKKKIPILAGSYSFLLPGAGQIYNDDYVLAGVFLGIEAAAIALTIIYDNKGDEQTEIFENYANQHWSSVRYAKWTLSHLEKLNPEIYNDQARVDYYNQNLFNGDKVNWEVLNELENEVSRSPGGQYYSHRLAPYGDQQYYEMIGKYTQFNVGWEDFGDENNDFTFGVDPVVEQFHYYSKQRGKANDYYNGAKWAVITIVTNHFISALEAAWGASRYNKKLQMNVSVQKETLGFYTDYYPNVNIKLNF
jgi:hypothetical protein